MSARLEDLVAWPMQEKHRRTRRRRPEWSGKGTVWLILLAPVIFLVATLTGQGPLDGALGGGHAENPSSTRHPRRLSRRQLAGEKVLDHVQISVVGPGINPSFPEQMLDVFLDHVECQTGIRTVQLPLAAMRIIEARCTGDAFGPHWPGAPWRARIQGAGYEVQLNTSWVTLAHLGTLAGWDPPVHESIVDAVRRERAGRADGPSQKRPPSPEEAHHVTPPVRVVR